MSSTFGILAHVDAGKTTLSEQLLFSTGVIRAAGRVDRKNSYLDNQSIERERGITIFSGEADFELSGRRFFLIDTPGHVDFAGDMERSLGVLDFALLVISAVEGIQSHTETIIRLLKARGIPVFVFINKCDRDGADPLSVISGLNGRFSMNAADFSAFPSAAAAEALAQTDERLLEAYFSAGLDALKQISAAKELVKLLSITPVVCGSALNGEGVSSLLRLFELLAPEYVPVSSAFSGRVYKVRRLPDLGRRIFFKVLSGTVCPKDSVACVNPLGEIESFKINELFRCSGTKYLPIQSASAGELCAASGLLLPAPGDIIGEGARRSSPQEFRPLLRARVVYPEGCNPIQVLSFFRELEDEEPLLEVSWNGEAKDIHVSVIGDIQLEVIKSLVLERFSLDISFDECAVLYRETIVAPVMGYGHFEPLRHYAEVHLLLEPAKRGSGISFESACPLSVLEKRWQNLIMTHVFEKDHMGVLTGAPLTDVKITLVSGRAHLEHTVGGDFREATYRAVRQGLMYAKSLLLEPWYFFEITVAQSLAGRILSDIQRLGGTYAPPEAWEESSVISGRAPVSSFRRYPLELQTLTRGLGRISLRFDGYEPCKNQDDIITAIGYDPDRDRENTADSMFCSHGAGYLVKWHEAKDAMHLETGDDFSG